LVLEIQRINDFEFVITADKTLTNSCHCFWIHPLSLYIAQCPGSIERPEWTRVIILYAITLRFSGSLELSIVSLFDYFIRRFYILNFWCLRRNRYYCALCSFNGTRTSHFPLQRLPILQWLQGIISFKHLFTWIFHALDYHDIELVAIHFLMIWSTASLRHSLHRHSCSSFKSSTFLDNKVISKCSVAWLNWVPNEKSHCVSLCLELSYVVLYWFDVC